ncbi:phage portal protein [Arsenicitalea aurantiaca]|uniref:Phage portal protein n=1 Tax=Arsenicitalea aurantiaca TaxID=1783274 RepID=A0A433XAC5_9HYPH|nr:phage portal protein [Arsenicitalea aurantiaca]RUT31004.1 phage portal protein [Arsenicitalea aurantiaca]
MGKWLERLRGPGERKAAGAQTVFAMTGAGDAQWSRRGFSSLAAEGFGRNPIVYRCVRLIAEAANRVPFKAREGGQTLSEHPALDLLARPNPRQSGGEMLESVYAYLQTAGNAYLEAVTVEGEIKGLYCLRPDRMRVVAGADGWPVAYSYTAGGRTMRLSQEAEPIPSVLHMALFHPLDDHYGMAPLEAAQTSLDIHNAASRWNKALLDNAARPSGALVYSMAAGNLTPEQFERLKDELAIGFQGAANAGRPMVLEGGLDWKTIALSPRDMDFIEAKNGAAREIALAFGVPPMLLGIPGDNTYANLVEANRALWRQTVMPLVERVADDLGNWLSPAFGGKLVLTPDFDGVEALAEDRAALWARVSSADFLSDAEKRALVGVTG